MKPLLPLLVAALLCGAARSDPTPSAAEKDPPVGGRDFRRASVYFAFGQDDAHDKAVAWLDSHRAHREAMASLQQCRNCHGGGLGDWVAQLGSGLTLIEPQAPWIGVTVAPADGVLRAQLRLPDGAGVVVTQVVPEGPAEQAGVEPHDLLLTVDGKSIASGEDLDKVIQSANPEGPPLKVKLLHEGQPVERQVTVRKPEPNALSAARIVFSPVSRIGANVSAPDDTLRSQLRLGEAGLVVTDVEAGSPAEAQGLKVNDVLTSADLRPLKKPDDLAEAVRKAGEAPLELELRRGGESLKVTMTPVRQAEANYVQTLRAAAIEFTQPRELMLVHPGVNLITPTTKPADVPSAAERIDQLSRQLDEMKQAVAALREQLDQKTADDRAN